MEISRIGFISALLLTACISLQDGDDAPTDLGFLRPADTTIVAETQVDIPLRKTAQDSDLIFTSDTLPDGAGLAEGQVYWTPGWIQVGEFPFRILVSHPARPGQQDTIAFRVTVLRHSLLRDQPLDTIILAGQHLDFFIYSWTPEGDTVTVSLSRLPTGSSLQGSSISTFAWKPEPGVSGVFRLAGTIANRKHPTVKDTFSFQVTVVADAPKDFQVDTSGGVVRVGDFARLEAGRSWIYSCYQLFNDGTTKTGRLEIRIVARDSSGVSEVKAMKSTTTRHPSSKDSTLDTAYATYHCSSSQGCGTETFLGMPAPFLLGNLMSGPLQHFADPEIEVKLTKEYRDSSTVYILSRQLGFTEHRFISNVGLVRYHTFTISSTGGTAEDLTLLEFH